MKSLPIVFSICTILIMSTMSDCFAERQEFKYPNAQNKLFIDNENLSSYVDLAASIGFVLGQRYRYTDFVEINREHDTGSAGAYEWLLLSTGGNENDLDAAQRYNKEICGWKMEYYSNHNLTMIYETCSNGEITLARVLKVCSGRNPGLNLE